MKILKWLGIILFSIVFLILIAGWIMNESLPENGVSGKEADNMALKMEKALGKEHWHDIQYIQWTFADRHHFLWDKHRNMVRVKWNDKTVFIEPGTKKGIAFRDDIRAPKESMPELLKAANDFFNNDMFWLIAPYKTFNEGVERKVVEYDGENRLLVTYNSGGSTPGDSYMWKLNDDGAPESYKMWTGIIPIGGVEATWENWMEIGKGASIAQEHDLGIMNLKLTGIKAGTASDMKFVADPFKVYLENK